MPAQHGISSPRSTDSSGASSTNEPKFFYPVPKSLPVGRTDMGVDWVPGSSQPIYAIGDGTIVQTGAPGWPGGGGVLLRLDHQPNYDPSSAYVYYYEDVSPSVRAGDKVSAGNQIGTFTGIEIGWATADGSALAHDHYSEGDVTREGTSFRQFLDDIRSNSVKGGTSASPGGTGDPTPEQIAKAASISTFIEFPSLQVSAESMALKGERSLLNDQQLLPFVEQLCTASLRNFQSMPNGNFFAFFPDYFGGLGHRTPYWEIRDIEIIDGHIDLSDDALATHVFIVGDTPNYTGQVDIIDEINTAGIVTVFNAFMADFLNGIDSPALQQNRKSNEKKSDKHYEDQIDKVPTLARKKKALDFLKKYGARPHREDVPAIRTPFFEMFLAYQRFCLLWSRQFLTTFTFTFMPELFPGGLVAFPEHGIQCYIDEVSHECDYNTGFVTRANLSAPAAIRDASGKRTGPNKNVHEGMIRSWLFLGDEDVPK